MHLLLQEEPRALYLVTSSEDERLGLPPRALIFKPISNRTSSQIIVEFLPKCEVDLGNLVRLTNRSVQGCLGVLNIANDIFIAVVTSVNFIGNLRPGTEITENVSRVQDVQFFCINSSAYDDLSQISDVLASPTFTDFGDSGSAYSQPSIQAPSGIPIYEHPCAPLVKILSTGTFYFAARPQWDISTRLGVRCSLDGNGMDRQDGRFIWNEYIAQPLLDFRERLDHSEQSELDACQFILLVIQGFVGVFDVPLPAPPSHGAPVIGTIALVSRLGWKRAGTRFNTRGVDDDGNCANFVETETIFSTSDHSFSYVQVRGSIPLFWEQQGFQTFGQKIQITKPQIASQPAFDRHFMQLAEEYSAVHAINLLGTKENEAILSEAYAAHIQAAARAPESATPGKIGITHFDFHQSVRIGGHDSVREIRRLPGVKDGIEDYGYTVVDLALNEVILRQKGVFRTNCLDCLDRTNFVEDILSRSVLENYLFNFRSDWVASNSLWSNHRELWAENGDALSRIYAGTGALNTSFTRSGKRTLAGVLADASKSVSRAYINNFQDKAKQTAIDTFLGNLPHQKQVTAFDPIHDTVQAALLARVFEYSSTKLTTIFTGTWNLNGRVGTRSYTPRTVTNFIPLDKTGSESLLRWLFPLPNTPDPDLFVIGFQEIVPLTAQQILQTDPEKLKRWEAILMETLIRRPDKKSDYFILRSAQLVGTALIILVRSDLTGVIRNVDAATRKTGLRGMSGNKGAVAIRLQFHDTSFCFITAHLAAGQANYEERNSDYRTIAHSLHFQRGRTIESHDNVIWLADTNYRIDLDNETVRALVAAGDLQTLLLSDQLKQAMASRAAFTEYEEGPILFEPTYRYNVGTDLYDTSEKMRIPAWTDRILYQGTSLDLSAYSKADIRSSDHRPVFALFRAEVRIVDTAKKMGISQQLLADLLSKNDIQTLESNFTRISVGSTHSLPPPSSDVAAWWEDEDHPNGVYVDTRQNFQSTSNPFDSSSNSNSSDDELYKDAQTETFTQPRKKPPPPPRPARSAIDSAQ
ncbi:DNase I-like protein [Cantharellus anzutake]|uniref:DNase I-like protein n=1 Tax=Cantharellus anzutake TaxID=1750568 RepID=UPI0019050169|nr:DNase I-like protein [Cantharellus anzutake]KAF8341266.1 DNase I-like protein [Cantharellus anzutake]